MTNVEPTLWAVAIVAWYYTGVAYFLVMVYNRLLVPYVRRPLFRWAERKIIGKE